MADEVEKIIIEVEEKGVKDTDKAMDSLNETLGENKEANEEATESQDGYNKSLGDTIKDTKIMGVSLNSLSASFKATTGAVKTSTSGLKLFKVALAATGIGLIVIALASLVSWLKNSRAGVDFLSDAFAVVGEIIKQVTDTLAAFGGAIVKIFKGDFKGAFEDAKGALLGFNDELRESIRLRLALEEFRRDTDQLERDSIVRRAMLERDIQKQLLITRDLENTTAQERLNAVNKADDLRVKQIAIDNKIAIARAQEALAEQG